MHAENVKEDVGYTEITAQKINEIDKISENSSLLVKEMAKDVTKELLPKTSTFGGNIVITNEPLNHNAANAQLTEKLIVHNNVNKKYNNEYRKRERGRRESASEHVSEYV